MTSKEFRARLSRRMARAELPPPAPESLDQLARYFDLLRKWNAKINLTGLPLQPPTQETFDRLFIEPLLASLHVPDKALNWFDLASGGGSPAIPLKIMRPALRLTMVESKARKAAFLREVVRGLNLVHARVENDRIEDIGDRFCDVAQLITLRAVRVSAGIVAVASILLSSDGTLMIFGTPESPAAELAGLVHCESVPVLASAVVRTYKPVFHVEQSR